MKEFRILIVDDNPDHRFFIKRALDGVADSDVIVTAVDDGEEAMAYLRAREPFVGRNQPHMVLLDLRMPRKSGLEVLACMRDDEALRSVPVCVLTSSDRPEDIRKAYDLGTNAYVVKNGNLEGLRAKVQAVYEFWSGVSSVPDPVN